MREEEEESDDAISNAIRECIKKNKELFRLLAEYDDNEEGLG